jgi:isoleucyl-tRNA synthetase
VSVHLAEWATYDETLIDQKLLTEMRLVQRLVSLGLAARNNVKKGDKKITIGVRQPLSRAQFVTRGTAEAEIVRRMEDLLKSELNVKEIAVIGEPEYVLNPLPQLLGKKFGKDFPRVQKALREGAREEVQQWGKALVGKHSVTLTLDGQSFEVTPEECEVRTKAADGYTSAEDGGYMAALDTMLTEELVMEGLAREVVRRVQTMRRDADFNISDNIHVKYTASQRLARAVEQYSEYIRSETLGVSLAQGEPDNGFHKESFTIDSDYLDTAETIALGVKRVD